MLPLRTGQLTGVVSSLHLILSLYLVPITSTLVTPKCVTSINVDKQTDFIVPIYYCVFAPLLCLLPESTPMESTDLLIRVAILNTIHRPVNRVCTRSLLRKVCLHTTIKSGYYSRITLISKYLKSIRQYFTSRHSV